MEDKYICGLKGLQEFLHVSRSTAERLVQSGVLSACTIRIGRLLRFEKEKVIEVLKKESKLPWQKQ